MSQSTEKIELNIEVVLTLDDQKEPQAIAVSGTGNMLRGAVRAIAAEALESHFGLVDHGWRIQMTPVEEGEQGTVFEVFRSIRHTLAAARDKSE